MFNSKHYRKFRAGLLALLVFVPIELYAVAYCALRDPVHSMQYFFPEFSNYRSIMGVVGPELRDQLDEKLPYEIHFNEFGKHMLYVAFDGKGAMGIVHARTEKGDWGLDELIWSFNMDMTVRDFRFQRSRSRWKAAIEHPEFKALLAGKSFDELRQLLNAEGTLFNDVGSILPEGAEILAATVLRSALKTIVVTEYVWGNELEALVATDP
jgi:hypothetical protein